MAQHDYSIANQSGSAFRADLNNALLAIVTRNSDATAPSTTYAHQIWVDTSVTPALIKQRNSSNNAWIIVGAVDATTQRFYSNGSERIRLDSAGNFTIFNGGNILADFSTTSIASRTYFQTTTTNGSTTVGAIPNGTSTTSAVYAFNNSDPTNSAYVGPTISNTAAIIRSAIANAGTLLPLTFEVGSGSETARFDTAGRLLVGVTSTAATANTIFQGSSGGSLPAIVRLAFNSTAPADGNGLGQFLFTDSSHTASAAITAIRDGGTWTSGTSQPTRFVFGLAADGSTTITEQFRITNGGVIAYSQATPISKSAAATLTVAELQNAIINYTGAAATLTLPTGTLTEAGFSGVYTNMAFEWSVINTGSGTCTIGAGAGHTITGSATIAVGASGRFASRRTAANTFVSYRLA